MSRRFRYAALNGVTRVNKLLFVSPRYLLPADMGGKIRTAHVLRGLKGGRFHVTLISPAPPVIPDDQRAELAALCDEFLSWPEPKRGPLFRYTRMRHLFGSLPVPVATDRSPAAQDAVAAALGGVDIAVVDFLHAAVLMPENIRLPSVLFTHNVEAEIFARHLEIARGPVQRALWRDQLLKMQAFEAATLGAFEAVVAVSERDRAYFLKEYGVRAVTIPTGVDLDYFAFRGPGDGARVVFTASMDSLANIDGVRWFLRDVWPLVLGQVPQAVMTVIGRNPDAALVAEATRLAPGWRFTGTVEDVRPHLDGACAYVIPLRVGGGTRIKAYEAMAFGLPVVSTAVGIEGLGLEPGRDFLQADEAPAFAAAVVTLLKNAALRQTLAAEGRKRVEDNFSARRVGEAFEAICLRAMDRAVSANPVRTPERGTSAA